MGGHGDHTQKLCLRPWLRKNKGKGPTEPRSAYKGGLDLHGPQAGLQGGFCASLVARDRVGLLLGQNAQHGQPLGSMGPPPTRKTSVLGTWGASHASLAASFLEPGAKQLFAWLFLSSLQTADSLSCYHLKIHGASHWGPPLLGSGFFHNIPFASPLPRGPGAHWL